MAKKRKGVKWGKIGAPKSAKRKAFLRKIGRKGGKRSHKRSRR